VQEAAEEETGEVRSYGEEEVRPEEEGHGKEKEEVALRLDMAPRSLPEERCT
jgi:hypothetical protein